MNGFTILRDSHCNDADQRPPEQTKKESGNPTAERPSETDALALIARREDGQETLSEGRLPRPVADCGEKRRQAAVCAQNPAHGKQC